MRQLEAVWPLIRWDDWLRGLDLLRGRDIVIPVVSRDFHTGQSGTYMNEGTHKKYFANLDVNTDDSVDWTSPRVRHTCDLVLVFAALECAAVDGDCVGNRFSWCDSRGLQALQALSSVLQPAYSFALHATLASARVLTTVDELAAIEARPTSGTGVLWYRITYDAALAGRALSLFKPIALYFGIWSESRRGKQRGCTRPAALSSDVVLYFSPVRLLSSRPVDVGAHEGVIRLRWRGFADLFLVDYDNCTDAVRELFPKVGAVPIPYVAARVRLAVSHPLALLLLLCSRRRVTRRRFPALRAQHDRFQGTGGPEVAEAAYVHVQCW